MLRAVSKSSACVGISRRYPDRALKVDREPFAELGGCGSDYMIEARVIRRRPSKDLDTDCPFLDLVSGAIERGGDYISQD